ncbi:hypothetical protein BGZ80_011696 [Entomortierella chlamydospora]|uniref:Uncharacterized protein n=1 Tax=Entomortierella chlamydospora TaxID=101097 RepID=A0A9P6MU17_9FUNG|nr:hypothetical protein BGZ79_007238 [Entomortierella chlamydospora]KAG0012505.1 hypothetical protein BGZ80_011696 [Entomortierella chlamydospora]
MFATAYPKLRSWLASITSPSTTHASGMLIILGILAAVADAESVKEPIAARNPKSSSSNPTAGQTTESNPNEKSGNQDMIYQLALGMLVSQGLIRLITYISNRREAAALAAQKKDDDLLNNTTNGDKKGKGKESGGLSLNALDEMDLDEEAIRKRRSEHLASLSNNATLLESDSEDEDYEESEGDDESESEDITEDESEQEEIVESEH